MDKESRIYIAGHKGMVGSAIYRHLQQNGYTHIITTTKNEVDLCNQVQTQTFFATYRPEYVFLAAAKVGGIVANNTYRAEFIYENLLIAANVIDAAYRNDVVKLINLGSSCIYPKFAEQPLKESSLLTGELEITNEPYAIAKIAAIKLCGAYNAQYGTEYLSLMPTNLYGTHDNYNLETSHVLPAMIRKFILARYLEQNNIEALRNDLMAIPIGFGKMVTSATTDNELLSLLATLGITKQNITFWGTGKVYREFLHADDVAKAAVYCINTVSSADAGEVINIGTGIDCTLSELADTIATSVGYSGAILFDATKPDGTPRKLMDVSKALSLGWQSSIPLSEGIVRTITEYRTMSSKIVA